MLKQILAAIMSGIIGIMFVSIIRNEVIDWERNGFLLIFTFLIILFWLGFRLYKNEES